ncbi:hypothetical protein BU17DRAFT_66721 [Hysterangium stoloniferum]|nr:hypothetical protein BU17DRAFT_66721 [Hysterangium stoloniferum]
MSYGHLMLPNLRSQPGLERICRQFKQSLRSPYASESKKSTGFGENLPTIQGTQTPTVFQQSLRSPYASESKKSTGFGEFADNSSSINLSSLLKVAGDDIIRAYQTKYFTTGIIEASGDFLSNKNAINWVNAENFQHFVVEWL